MTDTSKPVSIGDSYSKVLTTTDHGKEEVWVLFEDARRNLKRETTKARIDSYKDISRIGKERLSDPVYTLDAFIEDCETRIKELQQHLKEETE